MFKIVWNATRLVWFNLFANISVVDLSPNYMDPLHVTYSNCLCPSGMRTMTLSQSAGNMHGWEVADQARRRAEMARYVYKCVCICTFFIHIHVVSLGNKTLQGLWVLSGSFFLVLHLLFISLTPWHLCSMMYDKTSTKYRIENKTSSYFIMRIGSEGLFIP